MLIFKIFLSLVSVFTVCCAVCDTFNNTQIRLKSGITTTISGCIEEIQPAFEGRSVEEITVNAQKITRLSKDAVRDMKMLRTLIFYFCDIGEIDVEAFRNLPRLKEIFVVGNRIRELAGETFGRGMPVEILNLGFNELRDLERFKGVFKLKRLVLSHNQLYDLPEDLLTDCVELEQIYLNANKLKAIPGKLFANNDKLQIINLSNNKFTVLDLQPFVHLQHLNQLKVPNNAITNLSLHTTCTFKSFYLHGNFLNFLPNSVLEHLNVEELYLNYNPLLCTCISPIKSMLSRSGGKLRGYNGGKLLLVNVIREGTYNSSSKDAKNEFLDCVFPQVLVEECNEDTIDRWATKKFFRKLKHKDVDLSSRIKIFEEFYP